jgi:hypothetical protein
MADVDAVSVEAGSANQLAIRAKKLISDIAKIIASMSTSLLSHLRRYNRVVCYHNMHDVPKRRPTMYDRDGIIHKRSSLAGVRRNKYSTFRTKNL